MLSSFLSNQPVLFYLFLQKNLVLEGKVIKNISNFKYLGSELQEERKTERVIYRRLATTKRATEALNPVMWNKEIINNTKKIVYKSITESILLYGAETRSMRKANEKKLSATEMDFWRRSTRISRMKRKTNTTVRNLN